jgi:amino acid transporter
VKISLGANNACRVAWYYWLNNAIWVASATIFVMDVVSKMITLLSGFEIPFFWYLAASCVLVWVYVFLAAQPQNESTRVRNLGGIAKLTIVGCLVFCAIAFLVKNGGQMATEFNPSVFKPSMGAAFAFFPALIYNVMGFDAISADPVTDGNLPIHRRLLASGQTVIVENLTNLDQIGPGLFTFCALPLKFAQADGAPVRAVALFD